jgi:hypothetical protein
VLHHLGELAGCLGETGFQLERCPAGEGLRGRPAAHIAGKGKSTALAAAVVAVQGLALASAAVVAAVRSWLLRPGTTVPMLPSWPPGSAVEVAGPEPEPALEVEECTMVGSCTLLLLAAAAEVRRHRGLLAVMDRRMALANLRCCYLHKR